MTKPEPNEHLINQLVNTVTAAGGSAGNQKLVQILGWSQTDYEWVRDYLIQQGTLRQGRGRGGSVQLADEKEKSKAKKLVATTEPKPRGRPAKYSLAYDEAQEEINIEAIKKMYVPLQEDLQAFHPGMTVYRTMNHMFTNEDFLWRNLRQYKVERVEQDKVYLSLKNVKDAPAEPTNKLSNFYVRV